MRKMVLAVMVAAMVADVGGAGAQEWPTRPVTMVVPIAAGGALDVMARILASRISVLLGQPVIVENVAGGGGIAGSYRVSKAQPDGYQFMFSSAGFAINQTLYKKTPYNAATDFAPVVLVAEGPTVLVARKDLPSGSPTEFIAYAKTHQAKLQYGSPGTGTNQHLACVLFNAAIGVNVTHIPYRGGAQSMQDLLAGRIDYSCNAITTARPQIEANSVKAVAVLSNNRSPMLPNVVSAQELGLAGSAADAWNAFFLPKGTPAAIIQKLHDATVAAMDTPSLQERLKDIGATVVAPERRSPGYLQKFVESEIENWGAVIKAAGLSIE